MGGVGVEASGTTAPAAPAQPPRRRFSFSALLDGFFFVFAGLAAIWLAWLLFTESFAFGWWGILGFVLFWALLAYLVLPRLHRILTTIYVPDYFIGRARTSDGLLGDPVNLAVLGDEQQLHAAMAAAGWTRADEITAASSWRIITSTVTRRSYDEAPVSPLFLFGRQQDAAYQQEVAGNPAKRHHVRFWRCPDGWLLPGGSRVDWLAAGTFDRAVGFSLFTLQVTHKIDAETDIERDHIVADPARVGSRRRRGGAEGLRDRLPLAQRRRRHDRHRRRPAGGRRARGLRARRRIATGAGMTAVEKRPAFESPASLAAPVAGPPTMRRPPSTTAGSALVLLRVLAGVVWLVTLSVQWDDVFTLAFDEAGVPLTGDEFDATSQAVYVFVVVLIGVVLLIDLVLAVLTYLGLNWPRIVVMVISTFSISASFVTWWVGDQEITLQTTFLTLALDILVMLALSSRSARAYARRERPPRRRAR